LRQKLKQLKRNKPKDLRKRQLNKQRMIKLKKRKLRLKPPLRKLPQPRKRLIKTLQRLN